MESTEDYQNLNQDTNLNQPFAGEYISDSDYPENGPDTTNYHNEDQISGKRTMSPQNQSIYEEGQYLGDLPQKILKGDENAFDTSSRKTYTISNSNLNPSENLNNERLTYSNMSFKHRNKENFYQRPKNTFRQPTTSYPELTLEEGGLLLKKWDENHFTDFNSWLQVARARAHFHIDERTSYNASGDRTTRTKNYQCNLELLFNDKSFEALISNGFGKSKKCAKRMATKQMVTTLIQKDLIKYGLKSKGFLYSNGIGAPQKGQKNFGDRTNLGLYGNSNFEETPSFGLGGDGVGFSHQQSMNQVSQNQNKTDEDLKGGSEERNRRLKKELKRFGKRMQEDLKDGNFVSAVNSFCQILNNKCPDWNEIAQIWSYAVEHKNLQFVKAILDLIQHKRVLKNFTEEKEWGEKNGDNDDINNEFGVGNNNKSGQLDQEQCATQSKLKFMYGFGRIRTQNPYDIMDSQNFEMNLPDLNCELSLAKETDLTDPQNFNITLDDFPNRLTVFDDNDLALYVGFQEYEKLKNMEITDLGDSVLDSSLGMSLYDPPQCNLRIDQTTSKEFKEPNMNYLSMKLLNEMYDMLLYSGDLCFSLQAAEMLYSRTKLTDDEFKSPYTCYYYAHRKNMIMNEILESVYSKYQNIENSNYGVVNLNGKLQKVGYKFKQQVLVFTPEDKDIILLDTKLVRKGIPVPKSLLLERENSRVSAGEYVLLILLGEEDSGQVATDFEFKDLLDTEREVTLEEIQELKDAKKITFESIQNSKFFKKNVSKGKKVETILMCGVNDIEKDFSIKLFALPNNGQSEL